DLPKCQVHRGNAAKYLNGHSDGLLADFLHFAPKTSKRTIDDLYDQALAHLTMFSHTTIHIVRPALAKHRQSNGFAQDLPHPVIRIEGLLLFDARQQWTNTLKAYAHPIFGTVRVESIDTSLIMKVLEPIWASKPETAGRVRGRIERILDWAKVQGYRDGENP